MQYVSFPRQRQSPFLPNVHIGCAHVRRTIYTDDFCTRHIAMWRISTVLSDECRLTARPDAACIQSCEVRKEGTGVRQ